MIQETKISIRLTPGTLKLSVDATVINEIKGGPETLLQWLECQLGLPAPVVHKADRITEYAVALDTVADSVISTSMKTDRWATASELLLKRDELLLAGWNELDSEVLPGVVRDLARAAEGRNFTFLNDSNRLQRVLDALDSGQALPSHRCYLYDAQDMWPAKWRKVLSKINITKSADTVPHGPAKSALHAAQSLLLGGNVETIEQDSTFRYVHTRSESASIEFVAAILAKNPAKLQSTVICCEDDSLALRLDAYLSRIGLPTTGASILSQAHPVLQVLPLCLALCWEPVDPQALLDFLTLPIQPLPKKAASRLANALAEEPGLGSRQWEIAINDLCSEGNDPKGKLRKTLDTWLLCDRTVRGCEISSRLIRTRCGIVSQWASGYALMLEKVDNPDLEMIKALQIASGQASMLGELAESQGSVLSEPQMARLMEEAFASGVESKVCLEAEGGPIRVRSLSEINTPCDRLIWLGLGTGNIAGSRWSTSQLRELRDAKIDIDDGSKALSSLRSAEARGFCYVKESSLAVLLPQDLEKRWHPIWLAIRCLLSEGNIEQPLVLEDLISSNNGGSLSPFVFDCQYTKFEPPQKQRLLWNIPSELFSDRETVSATELQDRVGCPLKWTLNYQAKLRPSPIAELPSDFQLKGTFCHSIIERVFGDGGELPSVDEAVNRVGVIFDERLPLDAAQLAQPDKYVERQQLRGELLNATRVFVGTLSSGGYRIAGLEVELSGEAFGKSMNGWIDCVAVREGGDEAIIDFKYGGRSKYYSLIEDGKAVQLAMYAYGRSKTNGKIPAVAYLVLSDGLFYTPSESPVQGDGNRSVINGPAIQTVWEEFTNAISNAEGWLLSDAPIPARPLQQTSQWPDGVTIVLNENLGADKDQDVCRYCNFKCICGLQEIS